MRRALVSLAPTLAVLATGPVACDDEAGTTTDVGLCALSCDDGDMCTEDRCEPTTGACIHVPRDAANACTMDRHCDDGDPCTTDSCGTDLACGFSRCEHQLVPGCRSCVGFVGCDDGNHCTTDICGEDKLCRYTEEAYCDGRCRTWAATRPSNAFAGATSIYGRAEPKGGRSCTSGCECAPDLVLTDDFAQVSLLDDDGAWSCAVSGVCDGSSNVSCAPLRVGREYVVWGEGLADRDRAGAPIPADTAPQADVGMPQPGPMASRLMVEGYCMAPTSSGVAGRYTATLALDGEDPVTFEVELDLGTNWRVLDEGHALTGQSGYYEAWSGTSVALYLTLGTRYLRVDLFPGTDRLAGPVVDPSRAEDKPAIPGEPPPPGGFGARVGTMTLVLTP